jgi:CheY-like chemotaxis protein
VPKILFVDDSPLMIAVFKNLFKLAGYEVLTALDGETALATALEQTPDLVILDGVLPTMDGFEVCRRLRLAARMKCAKIMMFTGGAEGEDNRQARDAGADCFLSKEVEPPAVIEAARRLLANEP